MLIMRNNFYYSLSNYLSNTNIKNNSKTFLFNSIKNYYLTIQRFKFLDLLAPNETIKLLYSNMYFLNLLKNKTIDKWFIFKLIKLNEFNKYFNKLC